MHTIIFYVNKVNLPISFQKNSFEDDVHHALYLCSLLLQLDMHKETCTEATEWIKWDVFT